MVSTFTDIVFIDNIFNFILIRVIGKVFIFNSIRFSELLVIRITRKVLVFSKLKLDNREYRIYLNIREVKFIYKLFNIFNNLI